MPQGRRLPPPGGRRGDVHPLRRHAQELRGNLDHAARLRCETGQVRRVRRLRLRVLDAIALEVVRHLCRGGTGRHRDSERSAQEPNATESADDGTSTRRVDANWTTAASPCVKENATPVPRSRIVGGQGGERARQARSRSPRRADPWGGTCTGTRASSRCSWTPARMSPTRRRRQRRRRSEVQPFGSLAPAEEKSP